MATADLCFGPFRPVGVVSGTRPASFTQLYGEPMLMVPIRRTYQLYKGIAMQLVRGGPHFEGEVTCVAQSGKLRYVAEGANVHAFTHHKPLWSALHNKLLSSRVVGLVAIDDLLFTFGEDGRCVVWGGRTGDIATEFSLDLPAGCSYTCAAIPPHFTHKILVGCSDGLLRLYNFFTGKLIFTGPKSLPSRGAAAITSIATSAFKGIVAIGTSDARAIVYHFEKDEIIATFTHDSFGGAAAAADQTKRHRAASAAATAVVASLRQVTKTTLAPITAIAFRDDDSGRSLVTGNAVGEIAVWDLQEKCLSGIISGSKQVRSFDELMQAPHRDAVHTLCFVPQKPLLVSCGADNAMIEFRLDTVDGLALAVRERRGHTGRCTAAAFYNGDLLVTAGEDCAVRTTHIFSDRAGWELSQGKLGRRARDQGVSRDSLRLPPATQICCNPARNYQWASIVTIHDCSAKLCGWRMDTRALQHKTEPLRTATHTCTAVGLSQCGNYACIGFSSGHVTRVHLQDQSLLHFYEAGEKAVVGGAGDRAHTTKVTGVEVFQWADVVVTCAADGTVRSWRLTTGEPVGVAVLPSAATALCAHRPSLLVACGCADFTIRVVSVKPPKADGEAVAGLTAGRAAVNGAAEDKCVVVRTFEGHRAPLTSVALSPESLRHLVSAAADSSLMIWDLAAAVCIAQYRVPSPVTSLTFHPDSLFLATTHAGEPGAFLWTNRLRYGLAPEAVTPQESLASCPMLHLPLQTSDVNSAGGEVLNARDANATNGSDNDDDDVATTSASSRPVVQLATPANAASADDAITITKAGMDFWRGLSHLDEVKARNEPLLPPKKAALPFFLPTTSELRPTFIIAAPAAPAASTERFAHFAEEAARSEFAKMLVQREYPALLEWMSTASPSLIDLRVKAIIKDGEADDETGIIKEQNSRAAAALLDFVQYALRCHKFVDLVQSFVRMLFTVHGELLASHAELQGALEGVAAAQSEAKLEVHRALDRVGCLAATFANAHS